MANKYGEEPTFLSCGVGFEVNNPICAKCDFYDFCLQRLNDYLDGEDDPEVQLEKEFLEEEYGAD